MNNYWEKYLKHKIQYGSNKCPKLTNRKFRVSFANITP